MIIRIKNNLNLGPTMNSICERLNLGYGALNVCAIKDMERESETMIAVFPDSLKPGVAVHHYHGGAVITMLRRHGGWFISDVRINQRNRAGSVQRLTAPQRAFLNELDEIAA